MGKQGQGGGGAEAAAVAIKSQVRAGESFSDTRRLLLAYRLELPGWRL